MKFIKSIRWWAVIAGILFIIGVVEIIWAANEMDLRFDTWSRGFAGLVTLFGALVCMLTDVYYRIQDIERRMKDK